MSKHQPLTPDPADRDAGHTLPDNALVPVAARHDGWTPQRQRAFIETLADTGSVTAAAQAAGMSVQSAWRLRRRADAGAFRAAWEAALEQGVSRLLSIALDRAINGTVRQRYYHGELIGEERVHHNGLLMALIKRGKNGLLYMRARSEIAQDWDGAMARLEAGARTERDFSDGPYAVWQNGPLRVTDCPPAPDFRGYQAGTPHAPGYQRALTAEEELGLATKAGTTFQAEADRRALFGLDRVDRLARRGRARSG